MLNFDETSIEFLVKIVRIIVGVAIIGGIYLFLVRKQNKSNFQDVTEIREIPGTLSMNSKYEVEKIAKNK